MQASHRTPARRAAGHGPVGCDETCPPELQDNAPRLRIGDPRGCTEDQGSAPREGHAVGQIPCLRTFMGGLASGVACQAGAWFRA